MTTLRNRVGDQRGVIGLLGVLLFTSTIFIVGAGMVTSSAISYKAASDRLNSTQNTYNAESGAEDALLQIRRNSNYGSSSVTLATTFDTRNRVDTNIETVSGQGCTTAKQITASGFAGTQVRRIQLSNCPQPSPNIDFVYAMQAGANGINQSNNSTINGTTYSNGNHTGSNGASITGDAWVAGGVAVDASPVFDPATVSDQIVGRNSTNDVAQSFAAPDNERIIKFSLKLKKIGSPANTTVRLTADNGNKPSTTTLASGTLSAATVGSAYSFIDVSMSTNPNLTSGTKYWIVIDGGADNSNYYLWAHNNSYAGQEAKSSSNFDGGTWSALNTDVAFKVWTGGLPTSIQNLTVGSDAHANTLTGDSIGRDAYYQTNSGSSVGRNSYPGSADPPTRDLPVTDANLDDFKTLASAGVNYVGNYSVTNGGSATIGPMKINGNLVISNNSTLTLTGTLWVTGTISFSNNAIIRLASGYGSDSGAIVSDGAIDISNNVSFFGSGASDSFLMLATTSTSSLAINVSNNADSIILAAIHGTIHVNNNGGANALTADKLDLDNNAVITYVSGLADVQFSAGPGGSFQVKGWKEILLN